MNNKELILSKINELRFTNKHGDEFEQGFNNALDCISNFLISLPAEQPSEELEEAANIYANKQGLELKPFARRFFIAGANWQREQTINKASQWLNENVVEYHPRKGELRPIVNINAFREAMGKEDEPNIVNIEPPSFEESQGEFNSYNVALNG